MKPAPFAYVAPRSLDEALDALRDADDTKILAGGQSLLPILNMRLAHPARLVDLNRVPELAYVRERDGGYAIGAMTRDSAVERDERIRRDLPLLAEAIGYVGHPQIRNRGTIGGSIAHADPSAELPAVALCLDARLTVRSPRGSRTLAASDLYLGYLTTTLAPDEILTEVWLPRAAPNTGYAWLEFARRHGDYAIVGVGVALTVTDEAITHARIVVTGVGGVPVRATAAESILVGGLPDPARLADAVDALRAAIDPDADVHATAAYRRHLAGVLLARAADLAYERSSKFEVPSSRLDAPAATFQVGTSSSPSQPGTWNLEPGTIRMTVNGRDYRRSVEPRLLLSDFLRHELGLTGTHVGCEHGVCGACTVLVDGETVRSCLMLAVQADGASITTVEGLAPSPDQLHPIQEAFWDAHGLQCGFCTPGILISTVALLSANPAPTDDEIRAGLSGNLCRCTGYRNIVKAVHLAAERLASDHQAPPLPRAGEGAGG